jgi:hypothetical protein
MHMKRYWIAVPLVLFALAAYGLDRGIYIGSASQISEGILRKKLSVSIRDRHFGEACQRRDS